MPQNYPDKQGFALSFAGGELTMNGRIWTGISNVSFDQPTEEGELRGTRVNALGRTLGTMPLGDGTVTFSDERERMDFIDALGDGFREKTWDLSWVMKEKATGRVFRHEAFGCRVLSNPLDHEEGADALGGDIGFSAMDHKVNGKRPHS